MSDVGLRKYIAHDPEVFVAAEHINTGCPVVL